MGNQKQTRSDPQERNEPSHASTEWPHNPPLPPREIDPSGEGDALRSVGHPGDDTVFAANKEARAKERAEETEKRRQQPRTEDDAERSRTER